MNIYVSGLNNQAHLVKTTFIQCSIHFHKSMNDNLKIISGLLISMSYMHL